ncbi:hypothetical protein [Pseudomonas sp.]|uniref:AOC03_06830 family ribosome hibernation factor n=1 Tax=Pseudomonas sp. TaxID=306 RepID=UPI002730E160|nr:hypothetical protein [Pseudomonas sp.]MDP2244737.1 hypothetical protein [Pseudomonas sp.]
MKNLKSVLIDLKARQTDPAISVLMPTHRTFPDNKQDTITLKNLVKQAEERLLDTMDKREVWPIMELINAQVDAHDHSHNLDGLALFAGADGANIVLLPFAVNERAIIDSSFATRDIVRGLFDSVSYFIVVVSREYARLIHAYNDRPVHEFDRNTQVQGYPFPIKNNSLYSTSGHDRSQAPSEDNLLKEFLNVADKSLQEIQGKRGSDRLPVIVIGDARNVALFKELSDRPDDIVGEVTNSPDLEADITALVADAQPTVDLYRASLESKAMDQLGQARGADRLLTDLSAIYQAVTAGNAERLYVRRGYIQAGTIDADARTITAHDDGAAEGVTDDVIDELIEQVQAMGGDIAFLSAETLGDAAPLTLQTRY